MKEQLHTASHGETRRTRFPILKTALRSLLLLFVVLLMMPGGAQATHFRGGGLTWQQAGGNSIRFTLNTAWRRGYFVTNFGYTVPGTSVNIGSITYGDGTSATISALVVSEDIGADIINTSWTIVKTYSTTGSFVVNALNSNARVCPNRILVPTCNGTDYNLQTRVQVGSTNNSPVSSFPTVINMPIGAPAATFTIPATDPDGDPVTFRLARILRPASTTDTTRESGLAVAAPPNFTMSSSGVVTINTVGRTADSQYSVQVMVEDRNASTWAVKSKVPVDFLIRMVPASSPPIFTAPTTTSYTAPIGSALTFTVTATTTDVARTVTLMGVSIPVGSAMTPSLPRTGSIGGPVSSVFSWTPGSTQSGTYVITYVAQNDLGLQTFKSITIVVPCALDFSSSITSPTCNGGSNGAVTNTISNFSSSTNLSYSWSGPGGFTASTKDISGVIGGNYTFSVNDAGTGCVRTRGVTISEPSAVSLTATATQPTCSYNTGSVSLASSGGTGTITYSGSATTGLTTGSYSYTATDANGCTASATATITNPSAISFSATATQPTCSYNTGSVALASSGGTGAITYSGSSTTGLTTGSYSYTATDANGCTATATETITNPSAISFTATATQPTCSYNTGSVALASSGGTGAITYSGSSTTGLTTGSYSYTATDANGCTATATETITNPSAISFTATATQPVCGDHTGSVALTSSGGTGTITYSGDATTGLVPGTYNYTATDANMCTASTSQVIAPTDNTAPVITVSNVSVNNDAGNCSAAVTLSATASDNCSGVGSPAHDWTGGDFPVGTTTVNWTVTDALGNTGTATQTVTVTDNERPVISVSNVSVNNTTGTCGAAVTLTATPSDNCGIASGSLSNNWTGGAFPVGTTTVTWTVTDIHGNTGTATQTVTVTDVQNPTITAPASLTVNADAGLCSAAENVSGTVCGTVPEHGTLTLTAPTGMVFTSVNFASYGTPNGSCTSGFTTGGCHAGSSVSVVGSYLIGNNSASIPAENVVFGDPCVGTFKRLYVVATYGNAGYSLGAPTTGDNCGVATVTNNATSPLAVGSHTITWTVTDVNGNSATATQNVTVVDNQAPVISASNVTVNNDAGTCGAAVTLSATATDNCGVTATPSHDWTGGAFPVGSTTVNWTVTDINGNTGTATQTVTVTDSENPVITVSGVTANNDGATCGADITLAATATDNCSGVTLTSDYGNAGDVVNFPVGTTTITWTATDAHSNSVTSTQTVTISDNENPTITAPAAVTVNNTTGACSATVTLGTPTTGDNCGVAGYTNDHSSTTYPVGTTTVTWTVTDIHGNTATATQTVTVNDTQNPTITAPSNVTANNTTGACSATVSLGSPTTADNCGVASVTNNHSSTTYPVGTTTVTWTVTDIHGNTATATQTVTVIDAQNPTITAPSAVTISGWCRSVSLSDAGASLGTPTTADNCGVASVTNNAPSVFPVGTTTVTWTVTDIYGRTATATQNVTVTTATLSGSISVSPNPTVTGQAPLTIFLGYGPQTVTLAASVSGGTSAYTYSWSPASGSSSTLNVSPTTSTTYTVTITDARSCTRTNTQRINVVNAQCCSGGSGRCEKVYVCHNGHTICIASSAVAAHLAHSGDYLGECTGGGRIGSHDDEDEVMVPAIKVYPNPTDGLINVEIPMVNKTAEIAITDITGRVIESRVIADNKGEVIQFNLGNVAKGMYLIKVNAGDAPNVTKIIVR